MTRILPRHGTESASTPRLHRLLTTIAATLTLLSAWPVTAATPAVTDYRFDVIIFENLQARQQYLADLDAHEFLQRQNTAGESSETGAAYRPDNPVLYYQPLDSGELDNALKRLQDSGRYRVLTRKIWQQSGLTEGSSITIPLRPEHGTRAMPLALEAASGPETETGYLTGRFQLTFSRYIHLKTDFTLHHDVRKTDILAPYTGSLRTSRITLERKMRSGETQYIDHPLLGMLVSITRLPQPAARQETTKTR